MMPLQRRNEAQMVRSFWKQYPSYRVQPLLYKRYNELVAGELETLQGGRGVHRRRGPADGHRQQAPAAAEVRPGRARRRAPRCEGRGRGTEHPRVGRRGRHHVSKAMEERRQFGFRVRPNYGQVLGYIQEGEPITLELPKRNASVYMASHEPLSDQPTPHTHINLAEAFEADNEGYRGQPFPQPPRDMLRLLRQQQRL